MKEGESLSSASGHSDPELPSDSELKEGESLSSASGHSDPELEEFLENEKKAKEEAEKEEREKASTEGNHPSQSPSSDAPDSSPNDRVRPEDQPKQEAEPERKKKIEIPNDKKPFHILQDTPFTNDLWGEQEILHEIAEKILEEQEIPGDAFQIVKICLQLAMVSENLKEKAQEILKKAKINKRKQIGEKFNDLKNEKDDIQNGILQRFTQNQKEEKTKFNTLWNDFKNHK